MPDTRVPLAPTPDSPPEPAAPELSTEEKLKIAEAYLSEGLEPADFQVYDPVMSKRGTTTGPNGEKRPRDPIANAVHVMRVATGEAEEEYAYPPRSEEERVRRQAAAKARRGLAGGAVTHVGRKKQEKQD